MNSSSDLLVIAQRAQQSSTVLSVESSRVRSAVIQQLAESIRRQQDDILEANTLDLEASREMAVPDLVLDWLKLTPERVQATIRLLEQLAVTPDPLGTSISIHDDTDSCDVYGVRAPLGTVAVVYEAFPEMTAIAAGFCIRTGNVLILKGGSEASHSNQIMTQIVQEILSDTGLPQHCIQLIPSDWGDVLRDLVSLDSLINLVIPYGRNSLVQQVIKQATVPALRTVIGNCCLFWSLTGDVDTVEQVILDSHCSEPDPVNAIEKVLIHRGCNSGTIAALFGDLKAKGLKLKGDADLVSKFPGLAPVSEAEWRSPYLDGTIAFQLVDSLDYAIHWINRHSNGHADCIVTESFSESRLFATRVNSATVHINTSPRFYRYSPEGGPIALGMSNQRGYGAGYIGLDSLTSVKRIVQGQSAASES